MRDIARSFYEEEHYTSNPCVWKKVYYFRVLECSYCGPNRNENQHGRIPRHDRYKSVRKGRCQGSIEPPCREDDGTPSKKYFQHPLTKSQIGNWDIMDYRQELWKEEQMQRIKDTN